MKQTRLMSLAEAIVNVIVGYGIAVATQLLVFPWFELPACVSDALGIGAIFTIVSIVRSFALRRVFEAIRIASENGRRRYGEGNPPASKLSPSHSNPMPCGESELGGPSEFPSRKMNRGSIAEGRGRGESRTGSAAGWP